MNKRKVHTRISAAIIAIGVVLMAGKIYFDSEPGLVPLLLVVVGGAWNVIARVRFRSRGE